jgi:hypothetical protein
MGARIALSIVELDPGLRLLRPQSTSQEEKRRQAYATGDHAVNLALVTRKPNAQRSDQTHHRARLQRPQPRRSTTQSSQHEEPLSIAYIADRERSPEVSDG